MGAAGRSPPPSGSPPNSGYHALERRPARAVTRWSHPLGLPTAEAPPGSGCHGTRRPFPYLTSDHSALKAPLGTMITNLVWKPADLARFTPFIHTQPAIMECEPAIRGRRSLTGYVNWHRHSILKIDNSDHEARPESPRPTADRRSAHRRTRRPPGSSPPLEPRFGRGPASNWTTDPASPGPPAPTSLRRRRSSG